MINDVLYINGVSVKPPKAGGIKYADEPIWSKNTGRNARGKMVGDIVAWKRTIDISWDEMSYEEAKTIRDAIKSAGSYFTLRYVDPSQTGNTTTLISTTVYTSNLPRTLNTLQIATYSGITLSFVEQ